MLPGADYVDLDDMKATLDMTGQTFADADIETSITTASRAVDEITGRRFWNDGVATERLFVPRWSKVPIDDLLDPDKVEVVNGGSATEVTEGTDFFFYPLNALGDGWPYDYVQFLPNCLPFPSFGVPSVKITGTFGWPEVPAGVVTATTILATRLLRRQREAPFGIVTVGIEQGAVARIGQTDPDVQNCLCDYIKEHVRIA